ncbi:MAG: RNA polymerase sigma factor [candidate division Zixibacteria bacterium]|nr:RNA polymerase sigma factor [candidate division Zixibacteria bacterium]
MDRTRNLFWKLIEPQHQQARAYCRKLMGNREDGDDLFQDALVTAVTNFDSLRDTTAIRPWFYRIVVNTFKNRIRRPWWKRVIHMTAEIEDSLDGFDPTDGYAARRNLQRAFEAVSTEDQALVTLFELEGWTANELAALTGKTEGAIKVRLLRARRKMRETLARFQSRAARIVTVKPALTEDKICVVMKPDAD